ncbi:MAG: hypothetical protein V3U92_16700 [Cellulophaga sp.]
MDIPSLIVGAILGVIAPELYKTIKKFFSNRRRYRKAVKNLDHIGYTPESGFRHFDHAIPKYEKHNLKTELSDDLLIIPVPEKYKSFFEENDFVIRKKNVSTWSNRLNKTFKHLNVNNYQSLLTECAEEVAKKIKLDIESGLQRFNGEMLGVKKIQLQRIGEDENSALKLLFYKSDFFTYRVFAKAYEKLKNNFIIDEKDGVPDLNNYYTPFLSSFGIANFLIVDDGEEDRILFGYRSNNVEVDKNKIHFSMNEAFSLKDMDNREKHNKLSLHKCLERGLTEELGISADIQETNLKDSGFMSLAMDLNRFEIGLSSYSRLSLDENYTLNDLKRGYQSAQDGVLETQKINLVRISELESFLRKNKSEMSVSARNVINTFLARYKNGYL